MSNFNFDIKLEDVTFAWANGTENEYLVFNKLNLEIKGGQFIAIVAPSGVGKSTLLQLIAGMEQPQIGHVFLGNEILQAPSQRIGLVSQRPRLFPWLSVIENVEWGLRMRGVSWRNRRKIAKQVLSNVGLEEWAKKRPDTLSGGMQQRVAIGRALASNCDIFLLDEALVGLDVQTKMLTQRFLLSVWQRQSKTIVLVTHLIEEALLADRVIVLGGKPAQIIEDIQVNLERPRKIGSMEFTELQNSLWALIEDQVMAQSKNNGAWHEALKAPQVWSR